MDLGIKGKRALVTGASLGIGRAVAAEMAHEGCDVAMVARTEDTLRRAADDIARASGRRVVAVPADASVPEAIANAAQEASEKLGAPIDILVNNAGSTPEDGIDQLDFAKWQYSISLKQFGYARFAQLVLPAMRAQKWGRIVNVIGRSGHQPRPVYLAGGAVNAGLLNFTKALGEDCAKDNVLVTGVNPGPIDTPAGEVYASPLSGLAAFPPINMMVVRLRACRLAASGRPRKSPQSFFFYAPNARAL